MANGPIGIHWEEVRRGLAQGWHLKTDESGLNMDAPKMVMASDQAGWRYIRENGLGCGYLASVVRQHYGVLHANSHGRDHHYDHVSVWGVCVCRVGETSPRRDRVDRI